MAMLKIQDLKLIPDNNTTYVQQRIHPRENLGTETE